MTEKIKKELEKLNKVLDAVLKFGKGKQKSKIDKEYEEIFTPKERAEHDDKTQKYFKKLLWDEKNNPNFGGYVGGNGGHWNTLKEAKKGGIVFFK